MLSNTKERIRFFRFAIVGAVGSLIDFGVMNFLTAVIKMALVPAGTISFVCAVINNFIGNRHWTYPDSRSRPLMHQLGMFFLVNLAGVAIRIPVLHFFEPPLWVLFSSTLHLPAPTGNIIAKNVTLALAIGIVMLWNYFINRYWTYNDIL